MCSHKQSKLLGTYAAPYDLTAVSIRSRVMSELQLVRAGGPWSRVGPHARSRALHDTFHDWKVMAKPNLLHPHIVACLESSHNVCSMGGCNGYSNKPARRETTGVPFFDTNFAGDPSCNCFVRFRQLGASQSLAHDTAAVGHAWLSHGLATVISPVTC